MLDSRNHVIIVFTGRVSVFTLPTSYIVGIVEGKDKMSQPLLASQQPLLYRVWLPNTAPHTSDPLLTLHEKTAVNFFVQAVLKSDSLFTGKPFIMCAFYIVHELMERQIAEGTYLLDNAADPPLKVIYEGGIRTKQEEINVISAALIDAIADVIKQGKDQPC